MVAARRERAKKERTFLDVVKQLLEGLQEDISSIKASVLEIKVAGFPERGGAHGWDMANGMDWNTLPSEHQASCQNLVQCFTNSTLSPAAPSFFPSGANSGGISKETFLMYRQVVDDNDALCGESMSKAELANVLPAPGAPQKRSHRKRPPAKVRRRIRNRHLIGNGEVHEVDVAAEVVESNVNEVDGASLSQQLDDHSSNNVEQHEGTHLSDSHLSERLSYVGFGDRHEMVLPISGCTAIGRRGESFPLKLQRCEFLSLLPANRELLEIIETGFDTGSAYREDPAWRENPLSSSDAAKEFPAWIQLPLRKVEEEDAEQTIVEISEFIQATMAVTRHLSREDAEHLTRQRFDRIKHKVPEQWQEQLLSTMRMRCCEPGGGTG